MARPSSQLRNLDMPVSLDPLSLSQQNCIHSWFYCNFKHCDIHHNRGLYQQSSIQARNI